MVHPDESVLNPMWSDLTDVADLPDIDHDRLLEYRLDRLRTELSGGDVAMCVLVSPVSLRYALEYRSYALFQMHIPTTYAFISPSGPSVLHGTYGPTGLCDQVRTARALAPFDVGDGLTDAAALLANDIDAYLSEIGAASNRIALEYVNPSLTLALAARDLEVVDAAPLVERARMIKSSDEIACMRWSIAVAEMGAAKVRDAMQPGVTEVQLWGLLNYANLANDGDWHDGRMLASGDRINPWLQEASKRRLEPGDLVGFDTDMIGPFGYCADISRTYLCTPGTPTPRQRKLHDLAVDEVASNMALLAPGVSFADFQSKLVEMAPEYHENSYSCALHGVGMCDEFPRINARHRGPVPPPEGTFEAGMVVCVESYVGAAGERDGVKHEEMVLITETGHELLTHAPVEL